MGSGIMVILLFAFSVVSLLSFVVYYCFAFKFCQNMTLAISIVCFYHQKKLLTTFLNASTYFFNFSFSCGYFCCCDTSGFVPEN